MPRPIWAIGGLAVGLWATGGAPSSASPLDAGTASPQAVVEVGAHQVAVAFSNGPGRAIRVEAECLMPVPQERVWRVLADYDHLAEFVPFLTESRTIGFERGARLLRQAGRVGVWGFARRFLVVFRVTEDPMREITFDAIAGDFRQFRGHWHLEPRARGTVVRYTVDLEPAFFVPRWLLRTLERHLMLMSFRAIIQRCLALAPSMSSASPHGLSSGSVLIHPYKCQMDGMLQTAEANISSVGQVDEYTLIAYS